MKKLLMAVAAFGMLLTSCAKDDTVAPVEDKEALVSFCVNSPAVATRYGEGETAQDLYYAVYDTQEGYVAGLSKVDGSVEIKTSTTVNLNLVQGRSYEVIFWAQAEGAPYSIEWGRAASAATMTYDPQATLTANNEAYDAFYAHVESFEVKGAVSQTVELKRPFAQLNVATADTALASTAGVDIATTGVAVSGVYKTLNLANDTVDGETTLTFAPTAKAEGTIKANGKEYDHIAMNYLLVNAKKLVDVTLTLAEDATEGTDDLTRNYTSVPVQRNYRTNIIGNILTSTADFNVEIKPGFTDEDVPFTGADALRLAAIEGGEYTLEEDIVADGPIAIPEGVTFVLDLNGHTITVASGNAIQNKGTLIIKGNVTTRTSGVASIISESTYGVNNSGTLTVDGVKVNAIFNSGELTFNDGIVENTLSGRHGIYHSGSKLVINNGTFSSTAGNELIHAASANTTTINGGTFTQLGKSYLLGSGSAAIVINGGTFNGYVNDNGTNDKMRPGCAVVNGGTFNFDPTAWVAEGYKAMEKDGKWHVVPAGVTAVAETEAEIRTSLKQENAVVYVYPTEDGSAYKLEGKLSLANGVKLIGAGDEPVALFNDWGSNAFANQAHFTNTHIENVYFSNNLVIDAGIANGNVTFKGCVFGGNLAHQGVHFDSGNGVITFEDCTFVGRNMFGSSLQKVIFNNCKFENKKSSQTGADKWTGVNMWGKYEFNNCEFDTEATCNVKCAGVEADFNNCFYSNGKNIKEVVKNTPAHLCTIKFDGVKAASTVATTSAALNDAIAAGHTTIGLTAGNYTMPEPDLRGKTLTIVGTKDVVIDATAVDTRDQFVTGAAIVFEGVTINFTTTEYYMGFANCSSLTYKNCDLNGWQFLTGDSVKFENCNLNSNGAEHTVWTYGAAEVSFEGCKFAYGDRCVNVYVDNAAKTPGVTSDVAFTNCEFTTTNAASVGAVEVNSDPFTAGVSVAMNGCTAPANGHMIFISKWDPTAGATATIKVNGAAYSAPVQH